MVHRIRVQRKRRRNSVPDLKSSLIKLGDKATVYIYSYILTLSIEVYLYNIYTYECYINKKKISRRSIPRGRSSMKRYQAKVGEEESEDNSGGNFRFNVDYSREKQSINCSALVSAKKGRKRKKNSEKRSRDFHHPCRMIVLRRTAERPNTRGRVARVIEGGSHYLRLRPRPLSAPCKPSKPPSRRD